MSGDDWQPGDLALCVNMDPIECSAGCCIHMGNTAPPKGSLREVVAVGLDDDCEAPPVILTLQDGSVGHVARFRKIRPHTPDEEDAETIRLLTGNPAKVSERARIQSAALDRQAAELARADGITETQARRKILARKMILEGRR